MTRAIRGTFKKIFNKNFIWSPINLAAGMENYTRFTRSIKTTSLFIFPI